MTTNRREFIQAAAAVAMAAPLGMAAAKAAPLPTKAAPLKTMPRLWEWWEVCGASVSDSQVPASRILEVLGEVELRDRTPQCFSFVLDRIHDETTYEVWRKSGDRWYLDNPRYVLYETSWWPMFWPEESFDAWPE